MRISYHGVELDVQLDMSRGIRPPIRKQKDEEKQIHYSGLYTLQHWDEESEYQRSEIPQWESTESDSWSVSNSTHTWSDCGVEDNINFDIEPLPDWNPIKPEILPQPRLPSVVLNEENFRKGKCEHGTRFYHAEIQCISCLIKGALLDEEVKKPIEINQGETPDSDTEGFWLDLCAHGNLLDGITQCVDCITASHNDYQEPKQETLQTFLQDFQDFDGYYTFHSKEERTKALDQKILEHNWINSKFKKIRQSSCCVHGIRFFKNNRKCSRCNILGLQIEIVDPDHHEARFWKNRHQAVEERQRRKQQQKSEKLERLYRKQRSLHQERRPQGISPQLGITHRLPDGTWRPCSCWKKHREENRTPKDPGMAKKPSRTIFGPGIFAIHDEPAPKRRSKKSAVGVYRIRNDPLVKIPTLKHDGDAGYDLQTTSDEIIEAGSTTTISTGLGFEIPEGYCGKIIGRSSLASAGLSVVGGLIDQKYQGEIRVILANLNHERTMQLTAYDRVAQIVFLPVLSGQLTEINSPTHKTSRGSKGFGSTGVNAIQKNKKVITEFQDGKGPESKWAYKTGKQLTPDQENRIHSLMRKYSNVLATSFEEIKGSNIRHKHDIDTGDAEPIRQAPYPLPYQYKQWVENEIHEMLENGIIEPSHSPWSSPIVIAPKKTTDGKTAPRFCVNYKAVNAKTKKDAHPLPRANEILEQMQGNPELFTTIDLFSGFNQIELTKRAQERSAFVTPLGHYQYTRMPFGLCNAPATFQRVMNDMFRDLIGKVLFVYIDDITIYTKTFEEHLEVLEEVLRRIRRHRMFIKPKKCTFGAEEVHLLGHIINKEGVKTDPAKISAVKDYPTPESKTEVRGFMGLVGYYRHFIPRCSKIAEPINRTLKKTIPFKWTDEAQHAFEELKEKLTTAPILVRPDMNRPFKLHTDACKTGLGAVLTQDFPVPGKFKKDGSPVMQEKVISYASRSNHGAESNYGATQLEQLAVVWAVDHYKHYLYGKPFFVITDHTALKALMKQEDPKGKFARWSMKLQPYDIDMLYKPGRLHRNADALSRRPHRKQVIFVERLPKAPAWDETY